MDTPLALQRIKEAAEGLLYPSESDYPFEAVLFEEETASLEERLTALSGKEKGSFVERVTLAHFFRNAVNVYPDATPEQKAIAERFVHLEKMVQQELDSVAVYRIGGVQVDAFIIGKLPDGRYGGLRTKMIET